MFHYTMLLTNKATKKSKKVADLFLHRSIHDLGVREEMLRIYVNGIDLNAYNVNFIEK